MFFSATGCSIRSTPASRSSGRQAEAVASLQAWLMSTRTEARSPSACLIAATWAMLALGSPLPIFSLKMLWRRFASISSASAMSRAVSPLASVQATGNRSCWRPPKKSETGRKLRLPIASSRAVSTALLAKWLPWTDRPISVIVSPTRDGFALSRIGAI